MPSVAVPHAVEHGRVAGEIVARGDAVEVARPARIRRLAGQDAMDRDQVVPLRMRHRADDRQLIGPRREAGEMLADLDAGHGRRDRLELAADLVGRLGLHVERVVLPQPAAEQDHDHRPRPARRPAARGRRAPARQQPRQPHPQQPRVADLDETASRQIGRNVAVPARDVSWFAGSRG